MINQKFNLRVLILFMIMTTSWGSICYGQNRESTELEIFFRTGSSTIELDYKSNQETLSKLKNLLSFKEGEAIESIRIEGSASPDGQMDVNLKISAERANAVRRYIQNYFPGIPSEQISAVGEGVNWTELRKLVEEDTNTPNRTKILYIIDNIPEAINYKTNTSRKKSLMDLGVPTWDYMNKNMFPQLRSVVSIIVTVKTEPAKQEEPETQEQKIAEPVDVVVSEVEVVESKDIVIHKITEQTSISKPLFALKTNLLFDIASALNVEIEVPIGKRWSIAAEYIFPWWLWESKQYCFQTLSGNIEGRYWFGSRDDRPQLTGWFAGLYAGGGYYDFEFGDKGYQGEFFIASGISGGYAHSINKKGTLKMEYSLGVGYMQTQYREYKPKFGQDDQWHLMRQQNGTYSWFGPTRAKVSLVWMLNYKKKGGSK